MYLVVFHIFNTPAWCQGRWWVDANSLPFFVVHLPSSQSDEASMCGVFINECNKIKVWISSQIRKCSELGKYFLFWKNIINEVSCTCFWCLPNSSPKVSIAPSSLPQSQPSLSSPSGLQSSLLPRGKVVNPRVKVEIPVHANIPPQCKHLSSPSKFITISLSSKNPLFSPHQEQQQTIQVDITETLLPVIQPIKNSK